MIAPPPDQFICIGGPLHGKVYDTIRNPGDRMSVPLKDWQTTLKNWNMKWAEIMTPEKYAITYYNKKLLDLRYGALRIYGLALVWEHCDLDTSDRVMLMYLISSAVSSNEIGNK